MTPRNDNYLANPLPSSEESERVILGSILIDNRVMSQAAEDLKAEDFYHPMHRRVFAAMMELFEGRKPIDPILIGEVLKREGSIESIGGVPTITNLTYGLPHFSELTEYIEIVRSKHQLRELIKAGSQIVGMATAGEDDDAAVITHAQSLIDKVCTRQDKQGFEVVGKLTRDQLEKIKKLQNREITATGFRTGFTQLDHITNGFQPSDLIIVGGRPGMGKTMLAGQIATNACELDPANVVAVFSHEMASDQLAQRFMSSSAQVDLTRMKQGFVNMAEMQAIEQANADFQQMKIFLDDTSTLNATQMKAKLLRLKHEHGRLDAVIVDYLQRMSPSRKSDSRQQDVSSIARDLKSLAKDMGIPIIALSSLSRACELRQDKRPIMSDLRESGDIESEADMVAFVFRENYYDHNASPRVAEFIIAKHRHGPCETVRLDYIREYTRFSNYE